MLLSNLKLLATAPGGVARLRELILTLAVQGKLVPQDPSDEPANELVKKIRAEKDQLIAEGKIKRDKPLTEIAEEERSFGLPQGWEWVRVGQIAARVQYGFTASADHSVAQPKLLRITDIQNNKVNWDTVPGVQAGSQDISGYFLADGDLLIARTGGTIGKSFLVDVVPVDSVFASYLIRISPLPGLTPQYLKTFASSGHYWSQVLAKSMGTGQPNVNGTALSELVLALPPLAEQTRIVNRVEELMRLCDALEVKGQLEATQHAQLVSTLLATLTDSETPTQLADNWHRIATHFDLLLDRPVAVDALEQTILQLAVRGLLVPQDPQHEPASELRRRIRAEKEKLIAEGKIKRDKPLPPIAEDEQPFELPQGWEWVTLESLASQITDGAHHTPTYVPEGVPFLSVKDLSSGVINFSDTRFISNAAHEDLAKRCNPELGDLLLTKIGTTGIALVVNTAQRFSLFVSVALIKLPAISVDRDFLSLVINSPFVRQQSEDGTEGVGNKNLVLRKIKAFQIPLPPLAEQSRIVTRVTQLRRLCADLRQRLSASQSTQAHLAEALIANMPS